VRYSGSMDADNESVALLSGTRSGGGQLTVFSSVTEAVVSSWEPLVAPGALVPLVGDGLVVLVSVLDNIGTLVGRIWTTRVQTAKFLGLW